MIQEEKNIIINSFTGFSTEAVSEPLSKSADKHTQTRAQTHTARGAKGAGYPDNKVMLAKCDLISPQNYPGRIASKGFAYTEKNPLFGIFMLFFSRGRGGVCLFQFFEVSTPNVNPFFSKL